MPFWETWMLWEGRGREEEQRGKEEDKKKEDKEKGRPAIDCAGVCERSPFKDEGRECEDALCFDNETSIVADGMGGRIGANVASRIAVEVLQRDLKALGQTEPIKEQTARTLMGLYLEDANENILRAASEEGHEGMATTISAFKIFIDSESEKRRAVIGHLGDSAVYLFRKGKLRKLTPDHGYFGELTNKGIDLPITKGDVFKTAGEWLDGKIIERKVKIINMQAGAGRDPEALERLEVEKRALERFKHRCADRKRDGVPDSSIPMQHMATAISKALGMGERISPFIDVIDLEEGDILLTCSDGLTINTDDSEIEEAIRDNQSKSAENIKGVLQELALTRMNPSHLRYLKHDDLSIVIHKF